jgi:hypothetical protein
MAGRNGVSAPLIETRLNTAVFDQVIVSAAADSATR